MSTETVYSNGELRFFRLAKGVVDHSNAALRNVFKREWNYLYPSTPWQNNSTSGSMLLARERSTSRLYHPAHRKDYQHIKDNLSCGDVKEWDVTTLVFALNYSDALSAGVRFGDRWTGIQNAIYKIKEVRNALFSHARKASTSRDTFKKNIEILLHAVDNLLTSSDPLVEKLKTLLNETEFPTEDLLRYKQCVREDQNSLLLLEKDVKRLEDKMKITTLTIETTVTDDTQSPETSASSKIISRIRRRMDNLEREMKTPVNLVPSRFKPEIFRNARYIRLINKSFSMSYNFRWEDLESFLRCVLFSPVSEFAEIVQNWLVRINC